jgi:hypothetical protein
MIQTAATICTAALTSAIPSRDGATARSARYRTRASTGYSKTATPLASLTQIVAISLV